MERLIVTLEKYIADYLEEEYFRVNEDNGCGDSFWDNLTEHVEDAIEAYKGGAGCNN